MEDDVPQRLTGDAMPGWVRRAILAFFGGLAALYYLRGVVSSLRPLFIIVLISLFLSFAIEPAVNRLERMGFRRGVGTGVVFIGILALLGGFGFAMGSVLAEQINEFVDNFDQNVDDVERWLQDNIDSDIDLNDVRADFFGPDGLGERLSGFSDDLVNFGATIVNVLLQALTVGLFTFYLVAEGPRFRRTVCSVFQPETQREVLRMWDIAIDKTGGYILSRSILAVLSATFHWIAFSIIDVPFPLPMAVWMGIVSQFIPVVGTYLAGGLPLILAFVEGPSTGVWALVAIVVYQQIENYLFLPKISAQTMEIHVALAFGAVLAGGYILGPVGALLSLPFAATAQAFVSTYLNRHEVDDKLLDESLRRRTGNGIASRFRRRKTD